MSSSQPTRRKSLPNTVHASHLIASLGKSTGVNSIVKKVIMSEERVTFLLSSHPSPTCQVFILHPHWGTVSGACLPHRLWFLAIGERQFLFTSEETWAWSTLTKRPRHSISQGNLCKFQYWKGTKAYDALKICVSCSLIEKLPMLDTL